MSSAKRTTSPTSNTQKSSKKMRKEKTQLHTRTPTPSTSSKLAFALLRYVNHSTDHKEVDVTGMTIAQLAKLVKLSTFFRGMFLDLDKKRFKFSKEDYAFFVRTDLHDDEERLPIYVHEYVVHPYGIPEHGKYSDMSITFALPASCVKATETELGLCVKDIWNGLSSIPHIPCSLPQTMIRTEDLKKTPSGNAYIFTIHFVISDTVYNLIDLDQNEKTKGIGEYESSLRLIVKNTITVVLQHYAEIVTFMAACVRSIRFEGDNSITSPEIPDDILLSHLKKQ